VDRVVGSASLGSVGGDHRCELVDVAAGAQLRDGGLVGRSRTAEQLGQLMVVRVPASDGDLQRVTSLLEGPWPA
jgi:hypothetical protein